MLRCALGIIVNISYSNLIGLAHDVVSGEQRTFAIIENPETKDIFHIDFKLLKSFKD